MSLIRVASLKPNIQNKVRPLMKQARAGKFNSAHEAIEYYVMGGLLKREKTDMKDFISLSEILRRENLSDVEFDDITLLDWKYTGDPKQLVYGGKINVDETRIGVNAHFRIILTGKLKKDYPNVKGMTKKIEFTWYASYLFGLVPAAMSRILEADGYTTNRSHLF